jgi:arginase
MAFKNVIMAASRAGQKKKGVEKFPRVIRNYINSNLNIIEADTHENNIQLDLNAIYTNNMKYENTVNIGGDHSIAIATGSSTLTKYPDTKFIWFDAHADIHTHESSDSKNIHGMPLGYLTGMDPNPPVPIITNYLPFQNLLYIGIRDLEIFEYKTIIDNNIPFILSETLNAFPQQVCDRIKSFVGGSPVHFSFDVDAVDPTYIPTTGTAVEYGTHLEQTKDVVKYIIENENVVNTDIVEMNLELIECEKERTKSLRNFKSIFPWLFDPTYVGKF